MKKLFKFLIVLLIISIVVSIASIIVVINIPCDDLNNPPLENCDLWSSGFIALLISAPLAIVLLFGIALKSLWDRSKLDQSSQLNPWRISFLVLSLIVTVSLAVSVYLWFS